MGRVGVGNMKRRVYDPDADGLIAVAQIEMVAAMLAQGQGLGSGSIEIALPGAVTVAETEVFNGVPPTIWTDLDLSATIGANAALVMLKVVTEALDRTIAFRKDGDTDEFYRADSNQGLALIDVHAAEHSVFLVPASDAGVVEWETQDVGAQNVIVDVMAYIK